MNVLAWGIECCKLTLMAIILWYVCEALAMPPIPKRICQMLIVLIALLAAIALTVSTAPPSTVNHYVPNIIAPERR